MRFKRVQSIIIACLVVLALGAWSPLTLAQEASDGEIIEEIIEAIERYYLREVGDDALRDAAIRGILDLIGDPYASYLNPEAYERFLEDLEGSFGGIGVAIELKDGFVTVISVFEDSPANRAGIGPGDRFLEADGQDLTILSLNDAARVIRGDIGTTLSLKVLPKDSDVVIPVKIVRKSIVNPTVEWHMLEEGVGYVKISSFRDNTSEEVHNALANLRSEGMRVLVLDLRNNAGGLLSESVAVADALIPSGPVVYVVNRQGVREALLSTSKRQPIPIGVLVNGGTASGAEIVAGAIQDRGMGYLVGTRTYGKGTVQTLLRLDTGGGLKLTTAEYLLPSGKSIEGEGLEPDFVVERGRPSTVRVRTGAPEGSDIGLGASGEAVRLYQEDLLESGYDPGPLDGIFGHKTRAAVLDLQRDAGLDATGLLDGATRDALFRVLGEKALEDPQLDKALELLRKFL